MREIFIAQNKAAADWLIFLGMVLVVCFGVGIFLVWLKTFHKIKRNRHKRGHHRHRHRQHHKQGQNPGSAASARRTSGDRVPPPAR